MIWCPKCRCPANVKRFPDDRCPNPRCRALVGIDEALTKDPYQPKEGAHWRDSGNVRKRFSFDHPVESSGDLKSRTIDPTFGIKGRI